MTNKPSPANMLGLYKSHQIEAMNRLKNGPATGTLRFATPDSIATRLNDNIVEKMARVASPLVIKPRGKP